MSLTTKQAAEDVARAVDSETVGTVGFIELLPIIIPVIQGLMQLFQSCNQQEKSPEKKLQKYVRDRYNADRGEYDRVLFARTLRRVTHEAKRQNVHYTSSQLNVIARQTLDRARAASADDIKTVLDESVNSPSVLFTFED